MRGHVARTISHRSRRTAYGDSYGWETHMDYDEASPQTSEEMENGRMRKSSDSASGMTKRMRVTSIVGDQFSV